MKRFPLVIAASLSLVSCATEPKPAPWWKSLSDADSPVEDVTLSCRGIRSSDELDRLSNCWPPDAPGLPPTEVSGLETMRAELRECVLAGLPALVVEGSERARCHQGLAEVLDRRLYQLGWMKAEVTPREKTGTSSSQPLLAVQLGQRYRIGQLFVVTGPSQRINVKKIIKRAQKAIPKPGWCTQTALEEIHTRVFDPSKFQQVKVVLGAADEAAGRVPVIINIQE